MCVCVCVHVCMCVLSCKGTAPDGVIEYIVFTLKLVQSLLGHKKRKEIQKRKKYAAQNK